MVLFFIFFVVEASIILWNEGIEKGGRGLTHASAGLVRSLVAQADEAESHLLAGSPPLFPPREASIYFSRQPHARHWLLGQLRYSILFFLKNLSQKELGGTAVYW
jgi:hypothetical protein